MSKQHLKMIAYCGLFCGDCLRYKSKITDTARSLLLELEKRKFYDYAQVKAEFDEDFKNYSLLIAMLGKIIKLECKQSCREGRGCVAFECQILKCCVGSQYEGCWECKRLADCDKFDFLKPFHGETPKNNCIDLLNNGFENFILRKQVFYIWDQPGATNGCG
jgi:hypothetical protein